MYSRVHFEALVTNSTHLTIPPSLRGPCLRAGQLTPNRLLFLLFHFPFSFSFFLSGFGTNTSEASLQTSYWNKKNLNVFFVIILVQASFNRFTCSPLELLVSDVKRYFRSKGHSTTFSFGCAKSVAASGLVCRLGNNVDSKIPSNAKISSRVKLVCK